MGANNLRSSQIDSSKLYEQLFNNPYVGVLVEDENRIILEVNQSFCDFFGYAQPTEVVGLSAQILHRSEESYKCFGDLVLNKVLRNEPHSIRYQAKRKDGSLFWVRISGQQEQTKKGALWTIVDINEQLIVEEALQKSELKFRILADHTFDWESWLSPQGEHIYMSPSCERITGYAQEEFISNPQLFFELINPTHREAIKQHYMEDNGGEIADHALEFSIRTKSGEECWIEHHCYAVFDDQGNYAGRRSNNRDITERKQSAIALENSRERFKALHDASFGGVIIHDQGQILDCNQSLSEITGFSHDELIGMDGLKLIAPDSLDLVLQNIRSGYEKGYEVEGVRKDDSIYPLAIRGKNIPYRGHEARVIEFRDITDRKLVEEQLKGSIKREKEMANIVRTAPIAIAYGYPDGKLANCNAAFSELTQYSIVELQQVNWNKILTPAKWQASEEKELSLLSLAHQSVQYEKEYIRKDGSIVPIGLTVTARFDSAGNVINYIGFIVDITARKAAEEQLRQKHKMEAVGYMAGGIAHNFNNNLSIILGNVELSQLRIQDPQVQELLNNAKIAILRSRDIVSQIITYSRKGKQNKASIQLLPIIDETINLLSSTLPATINLQKIVDPDCNFSFIHADASQIQEILVNLCNNAIQAMDEKGKLIVSLEPAYLSQRDIPSQYNGLPGRYAKLSIKDNGCGMSADILDKIFDPFFTTKEEYKGAGMGLATVQGIVAQHDGVIKVNSIPDQGTVFSIYFPVTNKTVSKTEPSQKLLPEGTEKILFVDDDEMLASIGEMLLSEKGYRVTAMTESREALKLFAANPDHFDLMITDQTMPDVTGQELIQKLKKIKPDVRTILCTGYSSKINKEEAEKQGINAFCMKPLDLPELLQTVRRVLDEE